MNDLIFFSILLFIAWIIQAWLSLTQQKKFLTKIKELRTNGRHVLIGHAGTIYKGKTYSILSIDELNRIVRAEILRGWSTFSKIKAEPRLEGVDINDIEMVCDSKKIPRIEKLAYLNAASSFSQRREDYDEMKLT